MFASLVFAGALAVVSAAETRSTADASAVTIPHCLVSLIEEAAVAAEEPGALTEICAKEGAQVTTGQKLAQIYDARSRLQHEAALQKLQSARELSKNDINVRFANAAAKVAEAKVLQAEEANRKVSGTISFGELLELRLTHEKFLLEIEQSKFKMFTDGLDANVREAEARLAAEDLNRRRIESPLDGVVVEVKRHRGEWVQPGDVVMRVVRVDRLRIEGFLNAANYSAADVDGRPVAVHVTLAHGRQETFRGKVVFVSPQVEAGGEFRVWAELLNRQENEHWLLRPGLTADMTIELK